MIGSPVSEPVLPFTAPLLTMVTYSSLTRALRSSKRVQVEHVSRERLAARRTAQQERNLPVGDRLLGQVIINNECVLAVVHEVLAHGDARVGRDVLQGRGR